MIQTELVEMYMEQKSTCWLHELKTEHQPYKSLYGIACKHIINSVIWVPLLKLSFTELLWSFPEAS